ncbi:MAG TPA: family 10 glycosylhydrolase, partial [Haliscomenobacter sp.]|nr:family 10 glycosylhydrolase [Haliscomenobacter sp.]
PSIFPFAKTEYLQDWPTWVQNGWLDLISPQIYRYDLTAYSNELTKIISQQIPTDKLHLLAPGVLLKLGTYKPSEDFLKLMVKENRLRKINGELFFFYEGLSGHAGYFAGYAKE